MRKIKISDLLAIVAIILIIAISLEDNEFWRPVYALFDCRP